MKKSIPNILLIGAGRFGRAHLETWQRLEAEGLARVAGIVVKTAEGRKRLANLASVPVHVDFDPALLEGVDAVDIVTPSSTHFELVRQTLPHVHVLVEKPLGISQQEVRLLAHDSSDAGHVLMVNHLYRFHPVLRALHEMMKSATGRPSLIAGVFLNPLEPGVERLSANLELLHYFDILDDLFDQQPQAVWSQRKELVNEVSLRYEDGMHAVLQLGWQGTRRVRTLDLHYEDRKLSADFQDGNVSLEQTDRFEKHIVEYGVHPLEASMRRFLHVMEEREKGRPVPYPDARVGARVTEVALRSIPGPRKTRPRALVIGGGAFGAACALEIAKHCDVVMAERHSQLITEASWNNQLRHHSGFHYPRSAATIQEIRATRSTFDAEYGECIVHDVDSYYCTATGAREITGETYLAFCKSHKLNYTIENPPAGILDSSRVSLCLRTDELVLDLVRLRELLMERLSSDPSVDLLLHTEITGGHIGKAGQKTMRLESGGKATEQSFDYLINASYANTNLLSKWFGFPIRPIRFDLCEMMILEIPIPKVSVTILDAPFTSLMNTGEEGMFLAYQVRDGLMQSQVTADGLPPTWGPYRSNHEVMLRHMAEYLPALHRARYVGPRMGKRAIEAVREDFDGRPTVVTRHGFGCWSVLGGKICSCVSSAREIVEEMFPGESEQKAPAAVSASLRTGTRR